MWTFLYGWGSVCKTEKLVLPLSTRGSERAGEKGKKEEEERETGCCDGIVLTGSFVQSCCSEVLLYTFSLLEQ